MASPLTGPDLIARRAAVLALRASGAALVVPIRRTEVEVRIRAGRLEYRRPGRRGTWALMDPDAAELQRRARQYLADLGKVMRIVRLKAAREARAERQAAAKAERDAAIIDASDALGRAPFPRPEHDRAGIVAAQLGVSEQHVRKVIALWRAIAK